MNYDALIEEIERWRDGLLELKLATQTGNFEPLGVDPNDLSRAQRANGRAERSITRLNAVIRSMNDVAADLRRESNADDGGPIVSIGPVTVDEPLKRVTLGPGVYQLTRPVTFGLVDETEISGASISPLPAHQQPRTRWKVIEQKGGQLCALAGIDAQLRPVVGETLIWEGLAWDNRDALWRAAEQNPRVDVVGLRLT